MRPLPFGLLLARSDLSSCDDDINDDDNGKTVKTDDYQGDIIGNLKSEICIDFQCICQALYLEIALVSQKS